MDEGGSDAVRAQLAMAVRLVGIALWRRDLASGRMAFDERANEVLRRASDAAPMTDRQLWESFHPDDRAAVARADQQALAGSPADAEVRCRAGDGSWRTLLTRRVLERDAHGQPLALVGVAIDITEQVAERERVADIERLRAAAEQANRAKSDFLSRMSHDLRTPLNAVLGFTQLMLEDPSQPPSGKQREHLGHVHEAGRHMLALNDDVLDLANVELAPAALASEPVALAPLVSETLQWVAPAARRAQVMLSQGPLEGAALGDPRRVHQVVANLLSNAVKYNRPGGRVDVSVQDAGDSQWIGLRVRDTGRGLTEAQLRRLFEPFERLGAEREGIQGTGIGLTIVRALVGAMRGRIEVDSTPGVGSEFRVWLPRASAVEPAAEPAEPNDLAEPAEAPPGPLPPLRVVYIEDNAFNAQLMREIAQRRPNVTLSVAREGRAGIELAHRLRPQLVLIDIELPDIDGHEVLRALRADAALAGLVAIAVTAKAMPEGAARAQREGFDDYWTKPIDVQHVLARLDAVARAQAAGALECAGRGTA